jgi:hypothetical protein
MNLKEYIKQLTREVLDEESGTGAIGVGAGPIMTPYAFSKGKGKNAATKTAEKQGFKVTKGETEMPGDSKIKDYVSLTGKKKKKVKIYKESNYDAKSTYGQESGFTKASPSSNPSLYLQKSEYTSESMDENTKFKIGDKVTYENQEWEIENIFKGQYRLKSSKGLPSTNVLKSTVDRENKKSSMNENMSTAERLVKQAEKEGHIKGDYSQRVLDAAKKVAKEYDGLKNDEERKTLRDTYYNKFLKTSGLKESLENMNKTFTKGTKIEWTANDKTISKEYTVKKGDKGTIVGQEGTGDEYVVDFEKRFYANTASFKAIDNMNESLINIIKEELLNEVTYHKFKNEVKFRTKNEQLHKAIREVKRKLSEIDRIVEYTSRMKQELSEGEEGIKYWKATSKNVATISEMVNQLNNKIKNLQ